MIAWRLRRTWHVEPLLRRVAHYVLRAEGFETGELSIVVIGARAMSALHLRYLGVCGPTDVLSFDLACDRARAHVDGEVVLCADLARRRTSRGGLRAARAELALYLAHGILHLAGYDDATPEGAERMHAREDELLTALGLGAVYRERTPRYSTTLPKFIRRKVTSRNPACSNRRASASADSKVRIERGR